ncbi:MAG: hypothetical protein Q9190_007906 [Brigantiaea leucoxantha]
MAPGPIPPPPPPPPSGEPPPLDEKRKDGEDAVRKTSDIITTLRPTKIFRFSKPDVHVTSLDFDDSGELCIAACSDASLQMYSARNGTHEKTFYSQKYGCHLARFVHSNKKTTWPCFIYASTNTKEPKNPHAIRYHNTWDNTYIRYFLGHKEPVTALAVNPMDDTFISCSKDNTVRIWDLNKTTPRGALNLATPYLAAYDPSASVIAIASASTSSVLLYDLRNYDKAPFATFDVRQHAPLGAGGPRDIPQWSKLEFSNDGKSLLIASNSSSGHLLLDAFDGDLKAHLPRPHPPSSVRAAPLPHSTNSPPGQGDISFSADGRYLISGSGGSEDCVVWDVQGRVSYEGDRKILRPMCRLPCEKKASIVQWNHRFNMMATADREVVFWLPMENVGKVPVST